jgi:hypothetical protein
VALSRVRCLLSRRARIVDGLEFTPLSGASAHGATLPSHSARGTTAIHDLATPIRATNTRFGSEEGSEVLSQGTLVRDAQAPGVSQYYSAGRNCSEGERRSRRRRGCPTPCTSPHRCSSMTTRGGYTPTTTRGLTARIQAYRHNRTGEDNADAHMKRGQTRLRSLGAGLLWRVRRRSAPAGTDQDHWRVGERTRALYRLRGLFR